MLHEFVAFRFPYHQYSISIVRR